MSGTTAADDDACAPAGDLPGVGVARVDAAGRLVAVDDVLSGWHGRTPCDQLGRRLAEAVPDLVGELADVVDDVLAGGPPREGVRVHRHGVAGPGWVASVHPWPLPDGGRGAQLAAMLLPAARRVDATTEPAEMLGAERRRFGALERLTLVARAGEVMSSSLEPEVALERLCDLVVPDLADHAFIDLVDQAGPRRAAIRHADGLQVSPHLERPVGALARYRPGHPVRAVLEDGEPLLVSEVSGDGTPIPPGEDTLFVTAMGVTTLMVLPIRVAGATLGTVALACSASRRRYDAEDLQLARSLVDRAATAVDNALRYAEQRATALELQRSLMPKQLPGVEALDVAWRYAPGTAGTEVGGDWVDVVELPGGRIAVVVGDVMGRGLRAAAVMGQLRAAVRALAVTDPPPADLLSRLDLIVDGLGDDQIVTCVYAVFDPARGKLTLANAGHLPPLLQLDGRVYPLDGSSGVPLGVGGVAFTEREAPMPAGAVLALYSDGLVERRDRHIDSAVNDLADRFQAATGTLEQRCTAVFAAAPETAAGGFGDDVALLLVSATREPEEIARRTWLPAEPESVSAARRFAVAALRGWELDDETLTETVRLVVSELVTNAVRYSRGRQVEVLLHRVPGSVLVEVGDGDTRPPRMRHASVDEEGGRGLALVQAVASGWGNRTTTDGKVVWCRLDVPVA